MSKYNMNNPRPLLWMILILSLIFIMSCEDYEEQTFLLSDQEQIACDRLADTLSHELEAADLSFYGPSWTGKIMAATLEGTMRIGTTWFDADFAVESDIFVFTSGSDTTAAMQILNMVYDEGTEQVDSLEIVYIYNAEGKHSFAGLEKDTILGLDPHTSVLYIDFSQGFVTSSDAWNISISGNEISQASAGQVHRIEDANIASFTSAPLENYAADIAGYDVAVEYLTRNAIYLDEVDSLLLVELEASDDAGYLLWDRHGEGSGEIIFHASDLMTIAIWDEAGEYLEPTDMTISMESVAYCHDLKTRTVFDLSEDIYLVQFRPHEEMIEQSFHLAVLEGE